MSLFSTTHLGERCSMSHLVQSS